MFFRLILALAVTSLINLALCTTAQAAVHLSSLFGDGMVLQREQNVHVWGKAVPGEPIQVEIDGQQRQAISDVNGKWLVTLSPLKAGKF
jgi:sialate O-acetylesterase